MLKTLAILLVANIALMASGKDVFNAKCKSCHGETGHIKVFGKTVEIAGLSNVEIADRLREYKAGRLNQYGFGNTMKLNLALITDTQIKELAKYISTLN